MSNLTFYTMDEVIAKANYLWNDTILNSLPNLAGLPAKIVSNYGNWYGLWLDSDLTDVEVKAACYSQCISWTSWLNTKGVYWNDYIGRQKGFTGKQESTSKFLDTPETETDYSGDTHITNITKSTTEADNALGLETLRPVIEMMVHEFRKTWLLPKEAI